MEFRGVPNILVSTPKELSFADPIDQKMYQRHYLWEIQPSDGIITAKKLMPWLSDKTGIHIPYKESMITFIESMVYMIIFITFAYLVYTRLNYFLLHPILWMVIFLIGYFISCACIVFCILNHSRWVGEKDGKTEYVDPSSRSQFISEGLMISAAVLGIALLWIAFSKVGDKIKNGILKRFIYIIIIYGIYVLIGEVEDIFRMKNAYNPNFWPPHNYKKGSVRDDQGHTV